jgi:hypothetical protein
MHTMNSLRAKFFLTPALMLGLFAPLGLVGCGDTAETKTKVEQSSPTGTTIQEQTNKVKQTGSDPPPPTGAADAPAPK